MFYFSFLYFTPFSPRHTWKSGRWYINKEFFSNNNNITLKVRDFRIFVVFLVLVAAAGHFFSPFIDLFVGGDRLREGERNVCVWNLILYVKHTHTQSIRRLWMKKRKKIGVCMCLEKSDKFPSFCRASCTFASWLSKFSHSLSLLFHEN